MADPVKPLTDAEVEEMRPVLPPRLLALLDARTARIVELERAFDGLVERSNALVAEVEARTADLARVTAERDSLRERVGKAEAIVSCVVGEMTRTVMRENPVQRVSDRDYSPRFENAIGDVLMRMDVAEAALATERAAREAAEKLLDSFPRCAKLLRSGKPFFVVAHDEPYAKTVAGLIKHFEAAMGTWSEEDEQRTRAMLFVDEIDGVPPNAGGRLRRAEEALSKERAARERAEAACAEMRDGYMKLRDALVRCVVTFKAHGVGHTWQCVKPSQDALSDTGETWRAIRDNETPGVGWLSPEEAGRLRAEVEAQRQDITHLCLANEGIHHYRACRDDALCMRCERDAAMAEVERLKEGRDEAGVRR